jgi:hypothetical protein
VSEASGAFALGKSSRSGRNGAKTRGNGAGKGNGNGRHGAPAAAPTAHSNGNGNGNGSAIGGAAGQDPGNSEETH